MGSFPDQVLGSTEIHDIAVALGIDPDSNDLSQLRYGKVCILADADSDGLHIATYSVPCSYVIFRNWYKTVTFT